MRSKTYPKTCLAGSLIFILLSILSADSLAFVSAFASENASCEVAFTPDLPLLESNAQIEAEIDSILVRYMDEFLGTSAPSASDLEDALSNYSALNIVVSEGVITGNTVKNDYKSVRFLKTFANHLRHHPDDSIVREKANQTVWLVADQICQGLISTSGASSLYSFDNFARAAVIISRSFNDTIRSLFDHAMYAYQTFDHFWEPVYDDAYQAQNESISTDIMYNLGDALMAYSANRPTADERFLWMRGFKRWVERFASHTSGTANGIKPDGTGFHHWTAYDNYMYAFKTASKVIYYLANSSFQINRENYLRFRDAIYAQIVFGNNVRLKPISMSGRKPHARDSQYAEHTLKLLAIAGGPILGLSSADTILAGEYNRLFGVSSDFGYAAVAPLSRSSGFYQFNHANLGIFRKNDWLAGMKGFTNGLWGAELYATSNRYGRYQSYGTLEIIYPGDEKIGNGYNVGTWNWNYNPGATTIVLPWTMLHGEYARIDEYQAGGFSGALAFLNKNEEVLVNTHGTVGVFAMDFQEREGLGFSTKYGPNTHNKTFRWEKSTWAFEDFFIALGSGISNNDESHPTVTTLYQRLDNTGNEVLANGSIQDQAAILDGKNANWLISNYTTGFYLVPGNDDIHLWKGEQQTPNHDQTDPSAYTSNQKSNYCIGYINHGESPMDAQYEYMVIPEASTGRMEELDQEIRSGQKPYAVFQKNMDAHILRHHTGVFGYAIFNAQVNYTYPGLVNQVTDPCLIMYKPDGSNTGVTFSIASPELGIEKRSYLAVEERVISITLDGEFTLTESDQNEVEGIVSENGQSILTVALNDGLPVEIYLAGEVPDYSTLGKENFRDKNLRVYPNPAKDILWVDGLYPSNTTWKIYDLRGVCVKKGSTGSNSLAILVSDLDPGVYLLSLSDPGEFVHTEKVFVQ